MLLMTILSAAAWADAPIAPAEAPSITDAVALLDGCAEPGVCAFECWGDAQPIVEPAPNGSIRLICYAEDQAHGPMVVWRESGRPEGVGFSNKGVPHGGFRSWHPNGQRATEGRWVNGKAVGELTTWHPSGRRSSVGVWVDGLQEGLVTHWHANGRVAEIGHWLNGEPDGPMFSWYEDGAKSSHARFKDGSPHGRWREWHPNGKRSLIARFKNGEERYMRCWDAAGKQTVCPRDEAEAPAEDAQ